MCQLDGPVRFRGAGFAPRNRIWAAAATLVGLVALWQAGVSASVVPTLFLPAPVTIARTLWQLGVSGELWKHLSASLARLLIGWTVGTVFGIGMGLAVGLWSALRSPGMAVVAALFPIPKIALVPLFIVWFGIGETSKFLLIVLGVTPVMIIATTAALDAVPAELVQASRSLGASPLWSLWTVRLRSALPPIITGMRLAMGGAWTSIVAVELIAATSGLGYVINNAGVNLQTSLVLSGILAISVLGITFDALLRLLHRVADPSGR